MKKIINYVFLTAMFMLCLSGCGKAEKELPDTPDTSLSDAPNASQSDSSMETSIDPDSWGRDNSLDVYSAAVNIPLQAEEPENVKGGTQEIFLGADRAYLYKKYLLETAKESWDELTFMTADEERGSKRFDFENRLFGIGPVAGTDHYVGFDYEPAEDDEGENRYFLTERDENHQTVKEISLDFLASPADTLILPSYLAVDGSGIIHLVYQADAGQKYLLISPEGELLFSKSSNITTGLVSLYDGRIAFWISEWDSQGSVRTDLYCMDSETGESVRLASLKTNADCITLFDENTLLYADGDGVYRSGLSGENPESLYRWINHGIAVVPRGISALQADGKGEIALIYEDSENYNYLCLTPTTEEVEICAITLVEANDVYNSRYKAIVTEFNKRYPRWHIELKNDYDETALLTQLGAGDGPVLIDTRRTGFEELEKLWEPLDTVMEQLGMTEELVSSVQEKGKIHGIQYGVVTDFWLNLCITGNQELKEWDYDTFLQCIADSSELEAFSDISDYYAGGTYGDSFIIGYFSNGIDDAYFWDAEAGTTNFDSSEFRQALALAKKYCSPEEGILPDRTMLEEGKVFVNTVSIMGPEDVAGVRIYYGEEANCIGYPTKDGSVYHIYSSSPLAVRKTATEEEKEVAIAFIRFLLSYEGQQMMAKEGGFDMSVRWDMLEEQIAAMKKSTKVTMGDMNKISFSLGDQVNIELDRNTLLHWIDIAKPAKSLPEELGNILSEELEQYFSGAITEDMLIDRLDSRVGLYLNERK